MARKRLSTTNTTPPSAASTAGSRGFRDLQAQRHEEEREEEVPDPADPRDDLGAVRVGRDDDAGDQGAHLLREPGPPGDAGHQEAPRHRADHDELGGLGDDAKVRGQHEGGQQPGPAHEPDAGHQRAEEEEGLQVLQVGLDRQEGNRVEILEDQHSQGDPTPEGPQLELVGQELDDDERRRQRAGEREVEPVELAAGGRDHGAEHQPGEAGADRDLEEAGDRDRAPRLEETGRLISSPIRKRRRIRPISAISSMLASSVTTWNPTCGPSTAPARMYPRIRGWFRRRARNARTAATMMLKPIEVSRSMRRRSV